jgi:transposase
MNIDPCSIGIDVSKQYLDLFDGATGQPARIANAPEAIADWLGEIAGRPVFVTFEATGRYDARLRHALVAAGIRHARVNPARARDFARAIGLLAKTDRIDARLLAVMGATLRPGPDQAPGDAAARQEIAELHRRRDQLVAMRQQERLRLADSTPGESPSIERHLAWLDTEIATLEARRTAALRNHDALYRLYRLLLTVPGIGPVTATTVIALLPEIGSRAPKTIAALAGLAPFNVDSGTFRGARAIRGGRKRVRDAFYMAAVSVWRSKGRLGDFARNLIARGKPFKLAIIALARKILTIANAVIRDGHAYQP